MYPIQHSKIDQNEEELLYQGIFDAAEDGLIICDLVNGQVLEANPAACSMHGYARSEFIGFPVTKFIHPDNQYVFSQYMSSFGADEVFDIRSVHVRRDQTTFFAEWRGRSLTYQGQRCLLGMVRNISGRIQTEQLIHQQFKIHTHEQKKLLEISHTLASTLELKPRLILDQLHEIIEFTHAEIFALDNLTLSVLALRGMENADTSTPIIIKLKGPEDLNISLREQRLTRINDVWGNERSAQLLRSLLADHAADLLEGMHSVMWILLSVESRVIGVLNMAHVQSDYFTAHHADLALSVANQAAITMLNAELYKHAQALAVFEERQRLARNLHDAVNQSLFSAGLIAEVLPRLWERDQPEARQSLSDLRRLIRGAMAEMRVLLAELRPSTLIDSSLSDLLRQLGTAFSARTSAVVAVSIAGEFFLPAKAQVAFYRICQEGLYNIGKYAKASRVEIDLSQTGDVIELRIHDNGEGFDLQQTRSGHYGLSMMRERAEGAGALLLVTSQPGQGTEITLRWTQTPPKESL